MMANRKLPFGYQTRRGKICIQEQEAGLVKEIFRAYVEGASYQELARRLNVQEIPYSEPDKPWNKNMVARILSCQAYTGTELYPAILTEENWHQALAAKPSANAAQDAASKPIRQLARCARCGSPLVLSGNRYGWARWNCPACGALTTEAATPIIVKGLTHILSSLIRTPAEVQTPQRKQDAPAGWEDELDQLLHSDTFDESAAKARVMDLAAAQFNALGSEDYKTMWIRYSLSQAEQSGELNIELLRHITSSILVHPTGAVSLKLKNGQIIERG